jgi:serine/threonine protein kinase
LAFSKALRQALQRKKMRNSAAQMSEEKGWLLHLIGLCLDARFEIAKRIGVGSYAEIYLARNLAPLAGEPEVVVVKALNLLLHGALEPDLERTLIENIALEAQTLKGFDHPNIVRLFGYGGALDIDGRQLYYLVLEHMSGGSLLQFCGSRPLSLEQMLDFTQQVCAALSYAHSRGVLHRDVKPSNIMLSSDHRTVKLLDFGTARLLDASGSITKVGTDLYAAPEHYSLSDVTEEDLTLAADVYALAKTVYYMLCGTSPAPFKQRQITSLPAHLRDQSWAGGVLRTLRKATSSNPMERQQSVREFFEELSSAPELTIHTSRQRDYEPFDHVRNSSRIIIDVTPEPPRNYWLEFKSLCDSAARYLAYGARLIGRCVRVAWLWLRPKLDSCWIVATDLCRRACRWLISLPRKLIVRVAAVAALSLFMLIVTPYVLRLWYSRPFSMSQEQGQGNTSAGIKADATTDINIRSGPNSKTQKIGLVERSSRVRVLSCSEDQKWCEIEVIQHGRDKEVPTSADRGWVNRRYLTNIQQ